MSITVLKPGSLTTVQDLGRKGYQNQGVIMGGAMDKIALRIANLLVGNEEQCAVLEVTMQGPHLRFEQETLLAITGADLSASINDEPVRLWRTVLVKAGQVLCFGKPVKGNYAYIAIAGGVAVPPVMDSRSTYLRAGIGGLQGRGLQEGDVLEHGEKSERNRLLLSEMLLHDNKEASFTEASWSPGAELLPKYDRKPTLRAMRGLEYNWFSESSRGYIWNEKFIVTPHSDRMGFRLQGAALSLEVEKELLSTAVSFGTVQVPAEGNPVILMADSQTTGGYPRILQVITADLPVLAQVQPGSIICFEEVSLEEAQGLIYQQEKHLLALQQAIFYKLHQT